MVLAGRTGVGPVICGMPAGKPGPVGKRNVMFSKKKRFIAILSILLAGGFFVTSFVSYFVAHDSLTSQIAESTLPLTSDNIYSEMQQDLLRPIFISSLMAQDTFVRDWTLDGEQNPERIVRYLKTIQDRYGAVTAFFVSEKTRLYYHPNGIHRKVEDDNPRDAWYFRVRKMARDYEINVDTDEINRDAITIFINYRVHDYAGNYIGVTGVGLSVTAVKKLLEVYQHRYGRRIYFTDRQGKVTLHGSGYDGPDNIRDVPGLAAIATQILATPSGSYSYDRGGRTVYLNSRLVPEFQWLLLVEQEENLADSPILHTLFGNLLACFGITAVVLILANFTIGGYQRRLEEMATTDQLTGMANRQVFDLMFDQVLKSAKRRDGTLSVVMCDIDLFKQVNDDYGHQAGDTVLRTVAETARESVRDSDVICRWGGEEFLFLLPDCPAEQAVQLAEKVRLAVENRPVTYGRDEIRVTISLGVAELHPGERQVDLIKRSDKALYAAKAGGRNRVERAS